MKNRKGFTIVEVSLVLAIGGLILLMVFIALPALQRGQRDAQRRDDILSLLEKVKDYQQSNRGALPSEWGDFKNDYLGDNFKDPNGESYKLIEKSCSGATGKSCIDGGMDAEGWTFPHGYEIWLVRSAACDGTQAVVSSNPRRIAALYKLEGGGAVCSNT